MMTRREDGYEPALSEVRQRVEQDGLQARLQSEVDRAEQAIVDNYDIELVGLKKGDANNSPAKPGETEKDIAG